MAKVTLRPVRDEDVSLFEAEISTPEGAGGYQWFGYRSFNGMRKKIAEEGFLGPDIGGLTVESEGSVAGWVTWLKHYWGPETTSWSWSIGITIFAAFRGHGIGTETQIQLVDYLFSHTRAERIQAFTDAGNRAEQRALEKAGFQREGVIRKAQWRMGGWHDQWLYSILRENFNEK
ncbi:GNAT family protein [Planotetraspora phitsanulokensis]|uniref:Alanine acetyltransferase n=1 Tax=Planotetraspora phitsanulokensis TaxID=575192 RepID=A0A8J3U7E7_9ACTN|nr:GNAT family protein [Planotetraspora phitsanulokensis]GII39983.1 alanine acetyltransferase [Planotetraspora phitsanulokensis]